MESGSGPSSTADVGDSPSDPANSNGKASEPSAPATNVPANTEAIEERFKTIDSNLAMINSFFSLQNATKRKNASHDGSDSDSSTDFESDNSISDDEQLTRKVMNETVNLLGKLTNSHRRYQRTMKQRTVRRAINKNANSLKNIEREVKESLRVIGTSVYLEDKPVALGWVDWVAFTRHRNTTMEESIRSPLLAVNEELDWQVMTKLQLSLRTPQYTTDEPSYQQRGTVARTPAQELLPERLKINSVALKSALTTVGALNLPPPVIFGYNVNITILRPYRVLVYRETKLREHMDMLEKHYDFLQQTGMLSVMGQYESSSTPIGKEINQQEGSTGESNMDGSRGASEIGESQESTKGRPTANPNEINSASDAKESLVEEEPERSITALLHLRCLMKFFDDEIKPKLEYISSDRCCEILFHDLWHLYKPGDEVIDQAEKQALRVIQVQSPIHSGQDLDPRFSAKVANDSNTDAMESESRLPIKVRCAYIDYNGKEFGPVEVIYAISPYGGLKDIESLPVYPLRLAKSMGLRERLIARGKMLLDITQLQPMYYTGDALHTGEYIDSQVIVDFSEAFADETRKGWTPALEKTTTYLTKHFNCNSLCCAGLNVQDGRSVDHNLAQEFIEATVPKTPFSAPSLILEPRPLEDMMPGTENEPIEEEFLVMTYRAFGFVLRTRKWARLDLTHLRYENQDARVSALGAFDRLELPHGHREMVKSLVTQHFRDRKAARTRDERTDLVKGKGKGLIMLLHGAPGVGKTTTAEGVAELFQKPLFHITCGDLGTTARDVEQELEKNFAMASRWGCILLLDEADVFLSARERKDFERNGLVAVFLRVLEYYTGILFLTTNRIGDFDEAFASRIHMSLFYPELDEVKTRKVFKLNLDLIKERFDREGRQIIFDASSVDDFAQNHFREHAHSRWNGRQIRNACQTALALAEYDAHGGQIAQDDEADDSNVVVTLQLRHFRLVQTAYLDFGNYLGDIRGTQGDRRAYDYGLRAKSHTPYQTSDAGQSSAVFNAPGPNVNRYQAAGYGGSPYNSQSYPPQGSQMADLPHHQVSQEGLHAGGGAYTTGSTSAAGQSIYRQQRPSQGQVGLGGMYDNRPSIPQGGSSYSDSHQSQIEPRFYQAPIQQGGGQAWGNPGPGASQGYPPVSQPQQGQTMGSGPQWQNSFQGQQQYQSSFPSNYNNGGQVGGTQGPPISGAESTVQIQAPYNGQSGGPAGTGGGGPGA